MSKVNLDALIPRADFDSNSEPATKQFPYDRLGLSHLIKDLEKSPTSIYYLLKKPDFQRETCEWSKEKIAELIQCFIDRSFIPSIILWENPTTGEIYVIDGAHRLSAIIAYINNDYGDGAISQIFYNHKIPAAEKALSNETRNYINATIGAYSEIILDKEKAKGIKKGYFDIQKIDGDVKNAEDSFFKINEQGVVISPTERELCKSRHKPTCISTRAIMKGGSGTQYWKGFTEENQAIIKNFAEELHRRFFEPPYEAKLSSIIREHPLGGDITNGMPLIYNLLKIIKQAHYKGKEKDDTTDGSSTIEYLTKIRKMIWLIFSEHPGSLGLHPTVYFYNGIGKYIQSSFLGMFKLLIENQDNTDFKIKFSRNRKRLEDFLIDYKIFLTQLNLHFGSKERSASHMKWFFENLINYINDNPKNKTVITLLKVKYDFLNENESNIEKGRSTGFSTDVKSEVTIKSELESGLKCALCGGYVHPYSKDFDHDLDKKYGGSHKPDNAQITHVYCNNSKDRFIKEGICKPKG